MTELEKLRALNPKLPLYSVYDAEFKPYGRVLDLGDTEELSAALSETKIPESGNFYVASDKTLEKTFAMRKIEKVFGGMDIQAGYCNGHGYTLNALEYHKCSEVNFTTSGLVLLLALPQDMSGGVIDSASVKGFYLPKGTAIEVYPKVLHFAPCRISSDGFRCLVVLEKGVNSPLGKTDVPDSDEDKLLFMRGKWLSCHLDSPQAKQGAFCGISGQNIKLNIGGE